MNRLKINIPVKAKKVIVEVCRVLLGVVFVFSGFVKAVDPWGGAYKIQDYFGAFGLSWLDFLALPASFVQAAVEFSLGICLLAGVYRKLTSFLLLLCMVFMTPLTLYLAIANPVQDCGCFGDAWIITNWETFFKNIFLLLFAIVVFIWYGHMKPVFTYKSAWLVTLYTYIFIICVSLYCYNNLPVFDFRPYKKGADIPALMEIPEGMPHDDYETTFIYRKDGKEQEFSLENYPADDPSWEFVDSKPKLVKKGYEPPIHDFTITTPSREEITDRVLEDTAYTFLLIAYKFEKANDSNVDKINEIVDYSRLYDYNFYCLTASSGDEIKEWIENTGAEYPIFTTDEITLKTIIRSNPGLVLMKEGVVINKWHHRNIPSGKELEKSLYQNNLGTFQVNNNGMKIFSLITILLIPLSIIYIMDFLLYRRKKKKKEN